MFTTAAFAGIAAAGVLFVAFENWRRGDRFMAVVCIAGALLRCLFATAAAHLLVTGFDPMDWIRQPVPCRMGVC